jgi:hypothetical protein
LKIAGECWSISLFLSFYIQFAGDIFLRGCEVRCWNRLVTLRCSIV